jgi:hypothetical protein
LTEQEDLNSLIEIREKQAELEKARADLRVLRRRSTVEELLMVPAMFVGAALFFMGVGKQSSILAIGGGVLFFGPPLLHAACRTYKRHQQTEATVKRLEVEPLFSTIPEPEKLFGSSPASELIKLREERNAAVAAFLNDKQASAAINT